MAMSVMAWVVAIPLLGFLTGQRTMTPMAVLCWFAYLGHLDVADTWAMFTTKLVTVIIFTVLAAGELIGDKLPTTPNRISAFPLVARLGFGAMVGVLAATGLGGSAVEGGFLGLVSALAGAFLGFHLRRYLVKDRGIKDLPVALVEDALTIGLSVLAMGIVTG